ncbi:MAG: ATP-binding protein [Patescibacteria group bacterium]
MPINFVIDFYSILPLTCALFVMFFGVFILLKDYHSRMNQLLFGFCFSMFFWMFGTFMMFATRGNLAAALFWDRFVYAGVVFMPPFMHHFSLVFTQSEGKQKKLLFVNYFLAFCFLLVSQSRYFVDGLYYYSWGVHSQARILHHFFMGYFFLGTGIFFTNLLRYYRAINDKIIRLQIKYVFVAFAFVIFIGGSAYLFAYGIDTKFPFSYVTGLIFPVMLFYSVSRHHLLGAKVVATEILVGITEFLTVMQIFFSSSLSEVVVRVLFVFFVGIIGILLIKSIRKEAARLEEISHLAMSLEKANLRLQELDRQKTEFLSIASHQLRTPLSILKGFIELLSDGAYGKPTRKMKETLENMDESNERLVKLVDEFLDITRIEQGRTKFTFRDCDINAVIEGVVKELRDRARDKGIKISWENKKMPTVKIDDEKIRHVLFNFIDNAIKYSSKGTIRVESEREKDGIRVTVKDNGIGFDKKDEVNFFQKFYRGENVQGANVNGTGLGLYVCRKFIETHGGQVVAHSRGLGKGGEFNFWIPLIPPPQPENFIASSPPDVALPASEIKSVG